MQASFQYRKYLGCWKPLENRVLSVPHIISEYPLRHQRKVNAEERRQGRYSCQSERLVSASRASFIQCLSAFSGILPLRIPLSLSTALVRGLLIRATVFPFFVMKTSSFSMFCIHQLLHCLILLRGKEPKKRFFVIKDTPDPH